MFADHAVAHAMYRALADRRLWPDAWLLAWVLMPDHWHALIQLGEPSCLRTVVGRLKTHTARVLPELIARPVWEHGFHDHALRREQKLKAVARHIIMNPVRAGIADSPRTYAYWDAVWLPAGAA